MSPIAFNKMHLTGNEIHYIARAIEQGHTHGDGPYTKMCEELITNLLGANKSLLTTSGTAALEMSALLSELSPGDEVIMPSFTFVSTANAVVLRGAVPVFVDIRPDTLNLDEKLLESAITRKTRAIIPVHYAGVACEMDSIMETAKHHKLVVIEDAAHGFGARYKHRSLGTIGDFGMISFHQTKNLGCGEGGVLLINDQKFISRAEIIREKGTNRRDFVNGRVDKYTWCDIGSSYIPSDILAAFLLAQCENVQDINRTRLEIWNRYHVELRDFCSENGIQQPTVPSDCEANGHIYYLIFNDAPQKESFQNFLGNRGISTSTHFLPLHNSVAGLRYGRSEGDLPVTCEVASRILRLPIYAGLAKDDVDRIISEIQKFRF